MRDMLAWEVSYGTFRKYAKPLQRRDKRTFVWYAQPYTLTQYGPSSQREEISRCV
jgi:hypothetical protein